MGTNFYLVKKPCNKCGLTPEKIHLGKRSGGWRFIVRGYRWDNEIGVPVSSLKEMMGMVSDLTKSGWQVFDEYGSEHSHDDFKIIVENTKLWNGEPSGCHHSYLRKDGCNMTNDAIDDDGWSITFTEFS